MSEASTEKYISRLPVRVGVFPAEHVQRALINLLRKDPQSVSRTSLRARIRARDNYFIVLKTKLNIKASDYMYVNFVKYHEIEVQQININYFE